MQEYRHLEPGELALDPSFQRWKLGDEPVDSAFWQEWLVQNPDKDELVEKATFLLNTLHNSYGQQFADRSPLSEYEILEEISRLRESIDRPAVPVKWFHFSPVRYGMAASIVLVLGLFGWYLLHPTAQKNSVTYTELVAHATEPLSEVSNTSNAPILVNLPDKSTITLYPKSRVSYSSQFAGNKREIYLSGKGFFEVMKNPSKPFYVYANGLVTKVLGTSFTIQAYEGARQMKVVVKTGRVAVFAQNQVALDNQRETYKLEGIVLTPNQQVVFSPAEIQFTKGLVENPMPLEQSTKQQEFAFKRTPIADVFSALDQSYGVKIVFDEEVMRTCYLTASFSDESLFEKLELICRTINASYKQVDGIVIVNSSGCQ